MRLRRPGEMSYAGPMTRTVRSRAGSRFLLTAAAAVVVIAGLKTAQSLVIPFLLALFLAIICVPVVSWCRRA